VVASLESSAMFDGPVALTPKYAVINLTASGSNQIVAAVSGKKIRALAYNFMADAATVARFKSAATDKTGPKFPAANGGIVAPFNPVGWFETATDEALVLHTSADAGVGGELVYVEV
jgi:hypothetical protein